MAARNVVDQPIHALHAHFLFGGDWFTKPLEKATTFSPWGRHGTRLRWLRLRWLLLTSCDVEVVKSNPRFTDRFEILRSNHGQTKAHALGRWSDRRVK